MSCNLIYLSQGRKIAREITSATDYKALRDSAQQQATLQAVRRGVADAKRRLIQFNYSCLPGDGGALKGCKTLSRSVGMDVDHLVKEEIEAVKNRIVEQREALGLLLLERSARGEGLHIVFRRRVGLSQEENLKWASELLGVEYDKGAKDVTRVFFATTASADELLYVADELFDNRPVDENEASAKKESQATPTIEKVDDEAGTLAYDGLPYSDIVKRYWAMFYDGREPSVGNRNTLTFELAMAMRHICGFDEGVLSQVIPNYWASGGGDDGGERMNCIRSALSEPRRGVPFRLRQVLQSLRCERSTSAKRMEETQPPCRPEKLPPLLELLTSRVPEMYKGAVCESVWPSLGVHLHEVQFRYVNNELQEPTFMTVLMAPMSIGKGCVNPPIDYIMADIRQRDDEARRRDREWRESNRRKGANKEKSARPQDICVQWLMADMTNAAFVQRMADAERNGRRFLYSRLDEIEGLNQLRTSSRTDSVSQIIKLAFNCSLYGQERVGAESVNECTHVRWNWNASTTPANGKRFFRNAVNDGTLSRINLTTIMRGESDEMPIYGQYDETFAENLRPYIERLNACSGVIECPQALKLAKTLLEENAERAALCDSEAYRVLSYRANVIAYLKAMVLYVAHGYKWTKQMEQYVRWSEQMDLWCKMHFFGDELENLIGEETKMSGNGQQNLLEALPESFTRDEYVQMRQSQGRAGDGSNTLRVWKKRGYIDWDEVVGRYVKLKTCNR